MGITWKDTFLIMKMMFELNQQAIADCLGVSEFIISRLKTGAEIKFKKFDKRYLGKGSVEEIYDLMFDHTNSSSPSYAISCVYGDFQRRENYLLQKFKDAIEDAMVKDSLSELWASNYVGSYKDTVIYVLRRTKNPYKAVVTEPIRVAIAMPISDELKKKVLFEKQSSIKQAATSRVFDCSYNPADCFIGNEAIQLREIFRDAVLDHRIDVLLDNRNKILLGQADEGAHEDLLADTEDYFEKMKNLTCVSSINERFNTNERCMLEDIVMFNINLEKFIAALPLSSFAAYSGFNGLNVDDVYKGMVYILERIWSYGIDAAADNNAQAAAEKGRDINTPT